MAISAVDVALWDLKARLLDLPLHRLLGAARDAVPVYGSGGFTTLRRRPAAPTSSRGWVDAGHAPGQDQDRRVLGRDARPRPGPGAQARDGRSVTTSSCSSTPTAATPPAGRAGSARRLDELGVTWFEEPVSSDDLAGLRQVRDAVAADVDGG